MSLKYKIEATRTDDYIIEINSLIWTEKELKDWSKTFSDIDSTEDLAEILSVSMMKYGTGQFIEGFGYIHTYLQDKEIRQSLFRDGEYIRVPLDEYAKGIKVFIVSQEDYECNTEIAV